MNTTTLSPVGPLSTTPGRSDRFGERWSERLAQWFGLAPARPLTRTQEAAAVRAMASRLPVSEAAFASDLFAAADRHELSGTV